ncbi:MAG: hypothetical protein V1846_03495 [Candidatus Komeilibacteria bacterium]
MKTPEKGLESQYPSPAVWRHYNLAAAADPTDVPPLIRGFAEFYNNEDEAQRSAAVMGLLLLHFDLRDSTNLDYCEVHLCRAAEKFASTLGGENSAHFRATEALVRFFTQRSRFTPNQQQLRQITRFLSTVLAKSTSRPLKEPVYEAAILHGIPEILAKAGALDAIPLLAKDVNVPHLQYPHWSRLPAMKDAQGDNNRFVMVDTDLMDLDIVAMRAGCAPILYGGFGETIRRKEYDSAVTLLTFLSFMEGWRWYANPPSVK